MFHTFSGSSRRPRQVNLSGQNTNPFANNSWAPSVSGTQKTVANAQQERQLRQQERERLNASKRIQRTWRGHKSRRELADSRRKDWDAVQGSEEDGLRLVGQSQLLAAFFTPRRRDDIERLAILSRKISYVGYEVFLSREDVQSHINRLAHITLDALKA
jgi:ubiquitin-protein ligase E3 C